MTIDKLKSLCSTPILLLSQGNQMPEHAVYFLCENAGEIIYIGKAINGSVLQRCRTHQKKIKFSEAYFVECEGIATCASTEEGLILICDPLNNKRKIPYLAYVLLAKEHLGMSIPDEIPASHRVCKISAFCHRPVGYYTGNKRKLKVAISLLKKSVDGNSIYCHSGLQRLIRNKGLNEMTFARKNGIPLRHLQGWIGGTIVMSPENLIMVAFKLQCKMEELFNTSTYSSSNTLRITPKGLIYTAA